MDYLFIRRYAARMGTRVYWARYIIFWRLPGMKFHVITIGKG